MKSRIGIIGAGISGLTIAWLLRKNGYDVRVYEASDQPGGAMKTTRHPDGWLAEWGPNTIIESSERIKKLISLLGLERRRRYPNDHAKKRYLVRGGETVAAPDSLKTFLTTPLLSRRGKWQVLREPFIRKRPASSSDGNHSENQDESLADFVRRRLSDEFLKWPIDALAGGIYAGDPEQLSVRHAFPRLAMVEEQHGSLILGQLKGGVKRPPGSDEIPRNKAAIFSFDEGMQVLPNTLADQIGDDLTTHCRITSIDRDGTKWVIRSGGANQAETFDKIIYAGTAHGLANITFPDELASLLQQVSDITHPPVVSLTLGFRRADITHPLDGFGMLVPGIEQFPILGTLFTSSLFSNRAPDSEHVTLTTYIGGMRQPEMARKPEEEQVRATIDSLNQLIGLSGEPLFRHRTYWPRAIPQYHVGFSRYLALMNRAEQKFPGFFLAGNYRTGISVGDSINAAFDMAERVMGSHSQS